MLHHAFSKVQLSICYFLKNYLNTTEIARDLGMTQNRSPRLLPLVVAVTGCQWLHLAFKALAKQEHTSAIDDHIKATGQNIKWDHFEILASGKIDYHLNPTPNTYLTRDKSLFY